MPKRSAKHSGYLLKSGDTVLVTTGDQPRTIDLTGPSEYMSLSTPDMKYIRKNFKDGLYRIQASMFYSKVDDDSKLGVDDYLEIDPSDELLRLEKIVGTPLRPWKTDKPGISGQMEKQRFVRAGLRAKRERIQSLLFNLMRMLGRDPVERRTEENS